MRVAIAGSSGLIGGALVPYLRAAGHDVLRLLRSAPPAGAAADFVLWDPSRGRLDPQALAGCQAVVNLCGASVAARRWTDRRKRELHDSRVGSTRLLAEVIAAAEPRPAVFVCASATGYYGDRGDEPLTEDAPPGTGFLPELCRAWEAAAEPARAAGVRVVHLRIGLVLARQGGALARMLGPFRLGLGGVVGSGRQFVSWIHLRDMVRAVEFVLERDDLHGPVNAVAPRPVTNRELTRCLAQLLRRPALLPVPAPALRLLLGEMGPALLLASQRVLPEKLRSAGLDFEFSELEPALRDLLIRAPEPI